jgi:hypothetical protein
MSYTAKTDWTAADGVAASDLNRIEQGIKDITDSYTAADVLTKIKTVDGTGSGLDTDLFDGVDSSGYAKTSSIGIIDLNTVINSGFYRIDNGCPNAPSGVDYGQLVVSRGGTQDTIFQMVTGYNNGEIYWRQGNPTQTGGSGSWGAWKRLFHDGNTPQTRLNGTKLEYWNGTGWQSIMSYGSGQYHGGTFTTATTDQTVLSVTGMGKLNYLKLLGSFGVGYVTVIVDGVTISNSLSFNTTSSNPANTPGYYIPVGSNGQAVSTIYPASIGPIKADVSFESSLVIKLRVDTSSNMGLDWQYEVV